MEWTLTNNVQALYVNCHFLSHASLCIVDLGALKHRNTLVYSLTSHAYVSRFVALLTSHQINIFSRIVRTLNLDTTYWQDLQHHTLHCGSPPLYIAHFQKNREQHHIALTVFNIVEHKMQRHSISFLLSALLHHSHHTTQWQFFSFAAAHEQDLWRRERTNYTKNKKWKTLKWQGENRLLARGLKGTGDT